MTRGLLPSLLSCCLSTSSAQAPQTPARAPVPATPPARVQTLEPAVSLAVHGHDELAALVAHAGRRVVSTTTDARMPCSARRVFALLRLGRPDRAAAMLDSAWPDRAAPLELAAHATFERATGRRSCDQASWARLRRAIEELEQRDPAPFADASLLVHARYCLAALARADRAACERRATRALLLLEADTWQPGRGHHRARRRGHRVAPPEPADASLLVPLSYGMLLGTGDRMQRHLRATLDAAASGDARRWRPGGDRHEEACLQLIAAAQIGDRPLLAHRFADVVRTRSAEPETAALQLDAALFAVTGQRLAAGGGIDRRWLQLRPWLPHGTQRLEIRSLLAVARRVDIVLTRTADDDVEVALRLADGLPDALPVAVVGKAQHVGRLEPGATWRCRLRR